MSDPNIRRRELPGGLRVFSEPLEEATSVSFLHKHRGAVIDLFEEARAVISLGTLANDASLREESGGWIVQGDPTEAAFLVAGRKAGFVEDLDV